MAVSCARCQPVKPMLEFSVQTQRHASASDRSGCHGNGCGGGIMTDNSAAEMRPASTNTSGTPERSLTICHCFHE